MRWTAFIQSRTGAAVIAIGLMTVAGADLARAEAMPDADNGRYSLAPVDGGVIRLDTRSGVISNCSNGALGWTCHVVPDEQAALDEEIGRLQRENEALKARLAEPAPAAPGKIDEALPKSDSLKKSEPKAADTERKLEIPLPSDHDLDRMMGFLERAWRHLLDFANRVQKDASGRI